MISDSRGGLGLELGGHSRSGLGQPAGAVGAGGDDESEVGVGFPVGEMLPLSTDDDGRRPRNL